MAGGVEFFQTVMGRKFFEHTMPELARQLERVANALEAKKPCPSCGLPLQLIGSIGIADSESRWEAETDRYKCQKGHMVFIATDAAAILEDEAGTSSS